MPQQPLDFGTMTVTVTSSVCRHGAQAAACRGLPGPGPRPAGAKPAGWPGIAARPAGSESRVTATECPGNLHINHKLDHDDQCRTILVTLQPLPGRQSRAGDGPGPPTARAATIDSTLTAVAPGPQAPCQPARGRRRAAAATGLSWPGA